MIREKSESQNSEFKKGDKFILELGEERRMFDEFEIAGTDLYVRKSLLEKLTPYAPTAHPNLQSTCNQLATDTISRQAALDIYDDYNVAVENGELEAYGKHRKRLLELLSAQPEIIRCKDCKWFGEAGCAVLIVDDSDKPTEDDYCSFAERRTDGNGRD